MSTTLSFYPPGTRWIGTHIVPLATVMFRLLSTWFGFDLEPYDLNACRTDTACCWRLHIVPPSFMAFATLCPLPLEGRRRKEILRETSLESCSQKDPRRKIRSPQKHFSELRCAVVVVLAHTTTSRTRNPCQGSDYTASSLRGKRPHRAHYDFNLNEFLIAG